MPRTDKQIADYMKYYAGRGNKELQWALENLAKVEGKTPAEIREICEREATKKPKAEKKPRNEGGRPMLPREEIRAELLAGGTLMSVSEKLGVSHSTVGRERLLMVKEGLLKAGRPYPGRKKDKQPEAYPGQINDDEPIVEDDVKAYVPGEIRTEPEREEPEREEPEIEDDVKAYVPGEIRTEPERKEPEIIEPPFVSMKKAFESFADSLNKSFFGDASDADEPEETAEPEDDGADMFVLLDKMREWVEANFGEHIPIDMRCCNKTEGAQYHFRDPRTGKTYRISLYKQWEEDEEEEEE